MFHEYFSTVISVAIWLAYLAIYPFVIGFLGGLGFIAAMRLFRKYNQGCFGMNSCNQNHKNTDE